MFANPKRDMKATMQKMTNIVTRCYIDEIKTEFASNQIRENKQNFRCRLLIYCTWSEYFKM